jgi:Arylsulfatase A and related enzymes
MNHMEQLTNQSCNTQKRPNIVFIQNDHQAYYRWGWDGGPKPLRPNFDRLAQSGAEFENAYCTVPLCGPTRRSMLTGLYPHTHGQHHNYTDPPYNHEVYLDTLTQAGYKNYYFGKWHAGPGNASDHGCEGCSETDYGNPYLWNSYKDYLKRNELPQAVHYIEKYFKIPHFLEDGFFLKLEEGADYQCESSWCGEHCVGVTKTPKETHESFFLANLACEQLEQYKAEGSDKPFALRLDFWGPHQPHLPTQEFLDLYPQESFHPPVYGSLHNPLTDKPDFYKRERSSPFGEDNIIIQPSPIQWDEWTEIVRHCYAHISMVDAAAGLVMDKLAELGLDENTLIIYTTDHGDALASHGGHFDKGSYMSEEVMRIPCAMAWQGKIPAGQKRKDYICSIDYPVTMLDAAGLQFTKNPVHGKSILPLVTGVEDAIRREYVVSETYGHGYGEEVISRMVVCGAYKYIATKGYVHELYDLENDPFELKNQIDNPTFTEVLGDMRRRLAAWQAETNDPEQVLGA